MWLKKGKKATSCFHIVILWFPTGQSKEVLWQNMLPDTVLQYKIDTFFTEEKKNSVCCQFIFHIYSLNIALISLHAVSFVTVGQPFINDMYMI